MKQNIIFGIDVSSKSSTVCVVIDRIKQGETFKITNDSFGYQDLLDRLNQYLITPLVVFEATGVYSLSLQAFLEDYHIKYLKLNPLKAKKLMDSKRPKLKYLFWLLIFGYPCFINLRRQRICLKNNSQSWLWIIRKDQKRHVRHATI